MMLRAALVIAIALQATTPAPVATWVRDPRNWPTPVMTTGTPRVANSSRPASDVKDRKSVV